MCGGRGGGVKRGVGAVCLLGAVTDGDECGGPRECICVDYAGIWRVKEGSGSAMEMD